MASELAGMILGGGLVLVSTLYAQSFEDTKLDFPSQDEAIELYNKLYDASATKTDSPIIIAPKFGDPLSNLRYALTSIGFTVTNDGFDQFATVDLRPLIRGHSSFESERLLSAALFDVGLVMSPGEANGLTEAGFFRIVCTRYSDEQVKAIKNKLLTVLKTFKVGDKNTPIAVSEEKKVEEEESLPAEKKRRRAE